MKESFSNFLYAAGAVFATLLMLVAVVNYYYDPANIFGDRTYEAGVARLLSEGKDVANVTDYDERLVQKFFVERLQSRRDVLILGSSRSMNLGSDLFPGMTFYNASVSGATLEDDYAILQIYREHHLLPKLLVLGVDPWVFNRNSEQTRWRSLEQEYRRSIQEENVDAVSSNSIGEQQIYKLKQLLSFDYFRAAVRVSHRADRDYYSTTARELDVNIRRADGTITYKRDFAHRSPEKVTEWVRQQTATVPLYSLGRFDELDTEYIRQFSDLILRLRAEGIEVMLFMPPYHPDMYAALTRAGGPYELVKDVELYLRRFAGEHNLLISGSFDPDRIHCGREEFFDEMHPRPNCVSRILKEMLLRQGVEKNPISGASELSVN